MRRRGFTLLEVLLALGSAAAIAVAITAAFQTGWRADRQASDLGETMQVARVALESLARDLSALTPEPSSLNPGLVGQDADNNGMPADAIWLVSTSNVPALRATADAGVSSSGPGSALSGSRTTSALTRPPEGDLAQLEYYVGTDAATDPLGLVRKVRTLPTASSTDDDATYEKQAIAAEVKGLNFRYYDGASWTDTWDSAASGTFPVAIEVTVVVDLSGEGQVVAVDESGLPAKARKVTRTVALPAKAFKPATAATQPVEGGVR